jgi:hypothetical protein
MLVHVGRQLAGQLSERADDLQRLPRGQLETQPGWDFCPRGGTDGVARADLLQRGEPLYRVGEFGGGGGVTGLAGLACGVGGAERDHLQAAPAHPGQCLVAG